MVQFHLCTLFVPSGDSHNTALYAVIALTVMAKQVAGREMLTAALSLIKFCQPGQLRMGVSLCTSDMQHAHQQAL